MIAAGLVMANWDESRASYRVGVTARRRIRQQRLSRQLARTTVRIPTDRPHRGEPCPALSDTRLRSRR